MTEGITKLSSYSTILSVEERTETVASKKREDGTVETVTRSLGWFIRLDGSSAASVGMEKPPAGFKVGARVKHSIELAP